MTDRDHITAELRAVFDGQDIKDDAIRAVYLLGLRDGLSNPARARELLGWTFTGYQMMEAPKVVVASEVGGYSMTNRVGMDDDMWQRAYEPRSLEQRIVEPAYRGASVYVR